MAQYNFAWLQASINQQAHQPTDQDRKNEVTTFNQATASIGFQHTETRNIRLLIRATRSKSNIHQGSQSTKQVPTFQSTHKIDTEPRNQASKARVLQTYHKASNQREQSTAKDQHRPPQLRSITASPRQVHLPHSGQLSASSSLSLIFSFFPSLFFQCATGGEEREGGCLSSRGRQECGAQLQRQGETWEERGNRWGSVSEGQRGVVAQRLPERKSRSRGTEEVRVDRGE